MHEHDWHELMASAPLECAAEPMDSEDLLYILYTSGTTGKPKGIMHTTGGYLTGTYATAKWVFDLKEDDVYWCTADIGWVTGHSYVVYGPLANGATVVMYEGAPDWPRRDGLWEIVERYGVTIFYTAPTAIRAFMKWGTDWPRRHDMSSLRLLGSVGEPINPEAWIWYHQNIGGERCPIVDTWWQTETGMIMITPLPGVTPLKPGSATTALSRHQGGNPDAVRSSRSPSAAACSRSPGHGPPCFEASTAIPNASCSRYWSKWDRATYFTGDGAKRDEDGYFWVLGRVDDVINVAGHRIGTMEVESALVDHPKVAEAAVVGRAHELKGQAISAFVILKEGHSASPALVAELKEHVVKKIGSIARPDDILFAADLPKTRSGKIMRRLLKDIAEGKTLGDTTTLADPSVIAKLKAEYEEGTYVRRTGIDLSSTRCNVVDAETSGRRRRGEVGALRVHHFASLSSADSSQALTAELKALLERKRFPRRAWVNLWDVRSSHQYLLLPSAPASELESMARHHGASVLGMRAADVTVATTIGSTRGEPGHHLKTELSFFAAGSREVRQRLQPLLDAGFLVEGVTTPCGALWSQSRLRRPSLPGGVHAHVALGVSQSALGIFSNGLLLYARDLDWGYAAAAGAAPAPLDREALAGRLSAELRRSFLYLKQYWEDEVSQVLLCGDMPEIRSLTAPLIERLNIEVETLDTLEGIDTASLPDGFADQAARFRLASSIAVEPPPVNLLPVETDRRSRPSDGATDPGSRHGRGDCVQCISLCARARRASRGAARSRACGGTAARRTSGAPLPPARVRSPRSGRC